MKNSIFILGAGVTGLAAGLASGFPVFEAKDHPGGICSSYYLRPGDNVRLYRPPKDGNAYRFEIGGGHWIFGVDSLLLHFLNAITPVEFHSRKSSVYFLDRNLFAPYPLQNHLQYLGPEIAVQALCEMAEALDTKRPMVTMADWLRANFGPTLCREFFEPFHELYTAGLYKHIAPQDPYKSPVDFTLAIKGAFQKVPPVGYNVNFVYPKEGLDGLILGMANQCEIHYEKSVVRIDVKDKAIHFEDGSAVKYTGVLSTLPLNKVMNLTRLEVDEKTDPSTSVLVINIGALKGPNCPDGHWVYIPKSKAGFHRVGFYSHVDLSFLPLWVRKENNRVSVYVEKAYLEGQKPDEKELQNLCEAIVKELQEWGWIGEIEVLDPTWVEVAYTWSWSGSKWREKALKLLEQHNIYQVGRFARWSFQGIAESIREGITAGGLMKHETKFEN